jgi:Arc/MetJ family transcription regulator
LILRHQKSNHLVLWLMQSKVSEYCMRTTVNLDDDLLEKARQLSGLGERSELLREALRALIQRESARRLALLGGSQPDLKPIPRRQWQL